MCEEKILKTVMKSMSYIHIKIVLIIIIQACHHTFCQACHHTLIKVCRNTIFLCPYCTSTPVYAHYGVKYHPLISPLGYSHIPPPSILPSSMSPNLLPPDSHPNFSSSMSETRRIFGNQRSNLIKRIRRDARISRE